MPKMSMYHRSFLSVAALSGIFLAALAGAHLNNPELLISDSFARAFTSGSENPTKTAGQADFKASFQTSWAQTSTQRFSWQIEPAALRSSPVIAPSIRTALGEEASPLSAGITAMLNVGSNIVIAPASNTQQTSPMILEITDATRLIDDETRLDTSLSPDQWVLITARLKDGKDSRIVQFVLELPAQPDDADVPATNVLAQQNPAQVL